MLEAGYQYNYLGNLTQVQYPVPVAWGLQTPASRRTLNLAYNTLGRLTNMHNYYNSTTGVGTAPDMDVVNQVKYDVAGGMMTSFNYGNNLIETRSYDANRLQLTRLQVGPDAQHLGTVMDYSYSYLDGNNHNNGQLQQATDNNDVTKTQSYTYDTLGRLSTFKLGPIGAPITTLSFAYDPYGNRMDQTATPAGSGPTMHLAYTPATNRIDNTQIPGYNYDANGNMTAAPNSTVYAYDLANRLMSVTVGATLKGQYAYDGTGMRVSKVDPATNIQTFYFHSKIGLLGEYTRPYPVTTPVPTIAKEYVYTGRKAVATVTPPSTWTYNHADRLGSTRKMTNGSGIVIATRDYYPFGEEIAPMANSDKKFTGYYRDGESGLDYATNRYYTSSVGRFATADPARSNSLSDPQSLNKYTYVRNNPIDLVDPEGLFYECWAIGVFVLAMGAEDYEYQLTMALVCGGNPLVNANAFLPNFGAVPEPEPSGWPIPVRKPMINAPSDAEKKVEEALDRVADALRTLRGKAGCDDFINRVMGRLNSINYDKTTNTYDPARVDDSEGSRIILYNAHHQFDNRSDASLASTIAHEFYHVTQIIAGLYRGIAYSPAVFVYRFLGLCD